MFDSISVNSRISNCNIGTVVTRLPSFEKGIYNVLSVTLQKMTLTLIHKYFNFGVFHYPINSALTKLYLVMEAINRYLMLEKSIQNCLINSREDVYNCYSAFMMQMNANLRYS